MTQFLFDRGSVKIAILQLSSKDEKYFFFVLSFFVDLSYLLGVHFILDSHEHLRKLLI